ncbi:MAG: hypothetical protein KGJ88_08285 [Verrucomicrobiota bacterium]|nr:hypothetical protein [Verrucomicrobiota bacterium]
MNHDQAKNILLLYRPGMADADDSQVAEALALARRDPELGRWFEEHCARQEAIRLKFRQITVPEALKEQIISEQAAFSRRKAIREKIVAVAAVAAIVVSLITLAPFLLPHRTTVDNTVIAYENRMVGVALRGYDMDLKTNDPALIQAYLAKNGAPADYHLSAALRKAALTGCAIEGWRNAKVSMICFRTGRPLRPGQQSDLWLFVVDRASVKNAPPPGPPKIAAVNRLITAVWTRGARLYLLGTEGNARAIRQFL